MYRLGPDASKEDIEKEKKALAAKLRDALREYVPKPVIEPFVEMKPKFGQGIYFEVGEFLGESQKKKYTMPFRQVMWLRVIPTRSLSMPLSIEVITQNIGRFGSFGIPGTPLICENEYGVAFFVLTEEQEKIDDFSI